MPRTSISNQVFEGIAGSGKTTLANLLWPESITTTVPNDARGVGALEINAGIHCFKFDDASETFWTNSDLLSTIYTMFHNMWSAKIHSTKQRNSACMSIITTNEYHNLQKIAEIADLAGAKRRFLVAQFGNELNNFPPDQKLNNQTSEEFLELLLESVTKYNIDDMATKTGKEMLKKLKHILQKNDTDIEEEADELIANYNETETVRSSLLNDIARCCGITDQELQQTKQELDKLKSNKRNLEEGLFIARQNLSDYEASENCHGQPVHMYSEIANIQEAIRNIDSELENLEEIDSDNSWEKV